MPITVIGSALVRIAQHLIGLAGTLELLLGCMVPRGAIGMILERLLAIRALQLLLAHFAGHTENFVVVFFDHFLPIHKRKLIRWSVLDCEQPSPAPDAAAARESCTRAGSPRPHAGPACRPVPLNPTPRARADQKPRRPSALERPASA